MGELSLANHTHSGYAASNHTHIGYAASTHNHAAGDITSGTLPASRGGTGVTSISALKSALGISSTSNSGKCFPITLSYGSSYTLSASSYSAILIFDNTSYSIENINFIYKSGSTWYSGGSAVGTYHTLRISGSQDLKIKSASSSSIVLYNNADSYDEPNEFSFICLCF